MNETDDEFIDKYLKCVVCMDHPITHMILPCNHLVLCESCANQIKTTTNECIICKKQYTQIQKIYGFDTTKIIDMINTKQSIKKAENVETVLISKYIVDIKSKKNIFNEIVNDIIINKTKKLQLISIMINEQIDIKNDITQNFINNYINDMTTYSFLCQILKNNITILDTMSIPNDLLKKYISENMSVCNLLTSGLSPKYIVDLLVKYQNIIKTDNNDIINIFLFVESQKNMWIDSQIITLIHTCVTVYINAIYMMNIDLFCTYLRHNDMLNIFLKLLIERSFILSPEYVTIVTNISIEKINNDVNNDDQNTLKIIDLIIKNNNLRQTFINHMKTDDNIIKMLFNKKYYDTLVKLIDDTVINKICSIYDNKSIINCLDQCVELHKKFINYYDVVEYDKNLYLDAIIMAIDKKITIFTIINVDNIILDHYIKQYDTFKKLFSYDPSIFLKNLNIGDRIAVSASIISKYDLKSISNIVADYFEYFQKNEHGKGEIFVTFMILLYLQIIQDNNDHSQVYSLLKRLKQILVTYDCDSDANEFKKIICHRFVQKYPKYIPLIYDICDDKSYIDNMITNKEIPDDFNILLFGIENIVPFINVYYSNDLNKITITNDQIDEYVKITKKTKTFMLTGITNQLIEYQSKFTIVSILQFIRNILRLFTNDEIYEFIKSNHTYELTKSQHNKKKK